MAASEDKFLDIPHKQTLSLFILFHSLDEPLSTNANQLIFTFIQLFTQHLPSID